MKLFGMSHKTYFRRKYIKPLLDEGFLEMTVPDKPNIRNQRYVTTQKGRELLDN